MIIKNNAIGINYISRYLAIGFIKTFPMIAYIGIESGGRTNRHLDSNLLKPYIGFLSLMNNENSFKKKCKINYTDKFFKYSNITYKKTSQTWLTIFKNNREFSIQITSKTKSTKFLKIGISPSISPATIWGNPKNKNLFSYNYKLKELSPTGFSIQPIKSKLTLPILIHFPDYGLMRIESPCPNVWCKEIFIPSKENIGLNLGLNNIRKNKFVAFHHGTILLTFYSSEPAKQITLDFKIEKEIYPQIQGCNFNAPKWNGLKRTWLNAFTLEPESLTMGDNILLSGIAHLSIHFKSNMSFFTPKLLPNLSLQKYFKRTLNISLKHYINPEGHINWLLNKNKKQHDKYGYGWIDSTPSNLIALYNYVAATKDWGIIYDNITNIKRAINFLIRLDIDNDGIMEAPFHGNKMTTYRQSRNWWDNFAFGHKDAYFNLLGYRALKLMNVIFTLLNDTFLTDTISKFLLLFKKNFHKTFYNKKTGVYAGWVSRDKNIHDYMFTFISAMAINEGLVKKTNAKKILNLMLNRINTLGYGDFTFGIPGPLIPVAKHDRGKWEPMEKWGVYENGGLCGQTAYHFIQALYNIGMRKEADKILFTMIDTFERYPTHSGVYPGFLKSVDWRTKNGIPTGYNYLADNYYFLLAAVTGYCKQKMPNINYNKGANKL